MDLGRKFFSAALLIIFVTSLLCLLTILCIGGNLYSKALTKAYQVFLNEEEEQNGTAGMPMYYECGKLYVLAFLHTSTFGSALGYGVVVVAHFHLAVTGQRQTLTVGRSAPFSFH